MPYTITINNIEIALILDHPEPPITANPITQATSADYNQPDPRPVEYTEVNVADYTSGLTFSTYWQKNPNSLGSGGSAEVFKVKLNGVDVALKKFNQPSGFGDHYQDEKKIHISLKHPNIIQLIGYIESGGFRALVLELAQMTLQNYLDQNKNEQRDPAVCKQYSTDIINGVHYLHSQRQLHGDLKPRNILIVNGTAKLADFGSVKDLYRTNTKGEAAEKLSFALGTIMYMPPESETITPFDGLIVTTRYDIYPLCVILCLLTTKAQTSPPVANPQVPTAAPVQWQYLIHRGLNKNPEHRPLIQEFVDAVNDPVLEFRPQ